MSDDNGLKLIFNQRITGQNAIFTWVVCNLRGGSMKVHIGKLKGVWDEVHGGTPKFSGWMIGSRVAVVEGAPPPTLS